MKKLILIIISCLFLSSCENRYDMTVKRIAPCRYKEKYTYVIVDNWFHTISIDSDSLFNIGDTLILTKKR